jgi:hypothetical protein
MDIRHETGPDQVKSMGGRNRSHIEPVLLSVGPSVAPNFMTGIHFHCIMAWPTYAEQDTYRRVSGEMIADALRKSLRKYPSVATDLEVEWPEYDWAGYLKVAQSKHRVARGTLLKRFSQRLVAGRMAIAILHDELLGMPAVLPPGMTSATLNQLSSLVKQDTKIEDPENVESLVWTPSLPIIHLAISTLLEPKIRFSMDQNIGLDLQDVDLYRAIVKRAELIEQIVERHPRFKRIAPSLTRVKWSE